VGWGGVGWGGGRQLAPLKASAAGAKGRRKASCVCFSSRPRHRQAGRQAGGQVGRQAGRRASAHAERVLELPAEALVVVVHKAVAKPLLKESVARVPGGDQPLAHGQRLGASGGHHVAGGGVDERSVPVHRGVHVVAGAAEVQAQLQAHRLRLDLCAVLLGVIGLGWVGLGWVGLGVGWVGLGWVGLGVCWVGLRGMVWCEVYCGSGSWVCVWVTWLRLCQERCTPCVFSAIVCCPPASWERLWGWRAQKSTGLRIRPPQHMQQP
jgi:hypothetical protein